MLLAGGVTDSSVVDQGQLAAGKVLDLSLTIDHRVVNGVPAVRFLNSLVRRIETDPEETT